VAELWNMLLIRPMINSLLFLYNVLGHNFALSIAVLTVLVRLIILPLTLPQLRSSKKMQELQPQIQAIQKKYKNKEKQTQELMKLYKEAGVNPMGGCLPLLIQWPIILAFYQSIAQALADTPLQLLNLAKHIYPSFPALSALVPLESRFLWLNLARPDPWYILPILVVFTTWMQQKMVTMPTTDPQSASMTKTMEVTMPLMFGFITMSLASGLAVYFLVSNVIGIIIQYFVSGWGGLRPQKVGKKPKKRAKKSR